MLIANNVLASKNFSVIDVILLYISRLGVNCEITEQYI